MRLFESLLIALSTYSAVPVPQFDWNEKNMRYAICFFPAVGVLCGAALWLWAVLAQATGMSGVLFAAIAACLPILVTGGIHMDGYLDMVDAYTRGVPRRTATAALALAGLTAVATMVWMSPAVGGMAAAFAVLSALKYRRFALAQFGGVTGDTSGFFLQLCELCGLIGIWIGGLL